MVDYHQIKCGGIGMDDGVKRDLLRALIKRAKESDIKVDKRKIMFYESGGIIICDYQDDWIWVQAYKYSDGRIDAICIKRRTSDEGYSIGEPTMEIINEFTKEISDRTNGFRKKLN